MKSINVFIFGINSFVGKNLASYLENTGYQVLGTYRTTKPAYSKNILFFSYHLGDKLDFEKIGHIDWVIYCIHDVNSNIESQIKNYKNLIESIEQHNPSIKQIFISSVSSNAEANSDYGKTKFLLEFFLNERKIYIIRPGLIIGNGGLFLKLYNNILNFPITPLIGNGKSIVHYIGIKDLCQAIGFIINKSPSKLTYNLTGIETLNLYQFSKIIKKINNKFFIPIPLPLIIFEIIIYLAKILKIKLPINEENLKGYKTNKSQVVQSDLIALKITPNTNVSNYILENLKD